MPVYYLFGLHLDFRLGPRIEVYRNQARPLHVEEGMTHVRRRARYHNACVFVRTSRPSTFYHPRRTRSPSPEPQFIEIEPSESYQRRYASPPPSSPEPRRHYHSHYYHQVPSPPSPAPAPPPPVDPLSDLTARNAALEAEMRGLRDRLSASRTSEERLVRRCDDCGYTMVRCQCEVVRSARRNEDRRRYSSMNRAGSLRFDGAADINFEVRSPRPERKGRVRWADGDDWD
jgi:hypothetical protein